MNAAFPDDEGERLAVLREHRVLDTPPEEAYDDLVRLAARACATPIAAIALIDGHRQWFKAAVGLDRVEVPRAFAFCAHTILERDLLVVPDMRADLRFADNPFVMGEPYVRFYAGVPLLAESGHALGSLHVIDTVPRTLDAEQQDTLRILARQAVGHLRSARRIAQCESREEAKRQLAAIIDSSEDAIYTATLDGTITSWNRAAERLFGGAAAEVIGRRLPFVPADRRPEVEEMLAAAARGECPPLRETIRLTRTGTVNVSQRVSPMMDADGRIAGVSVITRDVTTRAQSESALAESHAALQKSEARLAEAQRVARTGSWEYDLASGKITWTAELFGLVGRDPALGEPDYDANLKLYHPEDASALAGLVALAAKTGDGYEIDLRLTETGGATQWRHAVGRAVRDASGKIVRLIGTLTDITERKMLEQTLRDYGEMLRRNEASLKAVLENAPVILYAADAAGIVTLSEGTALAALGLMPGEAVGHSVFEFSDGDPVTAANTRRALAGESVSWDARVDGLCLRTELRPLRDEAGSPAGVIGVCFDVTERTRAESLLAESRQRLALATEAAKIGIWDWDVATNQLLWDARMYELYGLCKQDFSGAYDAWRNGLHPDDRARAEAEIFRAVGGGPGFHTQFRVVWPDGTVRHLEAHAAVQRACDGSPLRMTGVNWDITERKESEERLRDYAVVLEFQKRELEKANALLEDQATTDGLTGLKNHRAFQERLSEEVQRAVRHHSPLSVILLDVDHFKLFNDAFGHPAGDAVLRAVASILRMNTRDEDLAARYGGEEFVLILPQTDLSGALALAERMRESVERHPWPLRAVTASFGVASLGQVNGGAAELTALADAALYQSKGLGRNCATCASPG